jgi:regulator of sigma E protease
MIYLAAVALVLGILVFVHEFGHYAVAKLCGVRVEVFSLGFGKRLWGFRRNGTDYRISLLPLGGYVKMAGENPLEARTGDPGEFTSHPRWQRFLVAIAGPAMNIVLAIVVFTGVYMFHHEYPAFSKRPVDIFFVPPNSAAEKAGIRAGDRIIEIDGVQNPNWDEALTEFALAPKQNVNVKIRRDGKIIETKVVPDVNGPDRIGDSGLTPPETIGTLEPDYPAVRAGIQPNDVLLSVNGKPVHNTGEVLDSLQGAKDNPVELGVWRDGKQLTFTVKPEFGDTVDSQGKKYRLGFTVMAVERLPFPEALKSAYADCKSNSLLIFKMVGKLISAKNSLRQMSGPIGITMISGEAAKQGFSYLMWVMALISLNLAIFNLLPIPILDGGLMLMLLIEGIMRREIKQEVKERVYQAAFVFLLLFAAVVIFNDVAKTLPGHGL